MKGPQLDPELVKLLEPRFPGLIRLILSLGITYINPKKRDAEDVSIFVWGVKGRSYQSSLNEYKQIYVVDGCLAEVVKDDDTVIDVINAGKEYYYLYRMCIDKLPLGMLYTAVSDVKYPLKIDEARMAYIREILMYLSDLDNTSIELYRNKLRNNN